MRCDANCQGLQALMSLGFVLAFFGLIILLIWLLTSSGADSDR